MKNFAHKFCQSQLIRRAVSVYGTRIPHAGAPSQPIGTPEVVFYRETHNPKNQTVINCSLGHLETPLQTSIQTTDTFKLEIIAPQK